MEKRPISFSGIDRLRLNPRPQLRTVLIVAVYLISFILLDFITKQFEGLPGIVTWYPPAGLTYSLLLVFGLRFVPAVTIALFFSSLFIYRIPQPPYLLFLWAIILSLIYSLATMFLRKLIRFAWQLRKLRDVAWLVVTAVFVSALLAVFSVSASTFSSDMPQNEVPMAIFHWWIGETVGVLSLTPFLLIYVMPWLKQFVEGQPESLRARRSFPRPTLSGIGQAASLLIVLYLVFGMRVLDEFNPLYLIIFPLIWIALHRGLKGVSAAIPALNFGMVIGLWLFRFDPARLGELELLMIVICIVGLLTGAVVTERKQAEDALRVSEGRYRRLHESMRDCFTQANMSGEIVDANPAFLAMLGYSEQEVFELRYQDLTPERWIAFEQGIVETQILPLGHSNVYEKEYIKKDGTVFPVELRTFLLRDDDGQPSGMWAIVRDITERKRTEDALHQSETLLESVIENLPVGIWRVDRMGQIVQGNLAGQKIWAGIRYVGLSDYSVYKSWRVATGELIQPDEWAAVRAVTHGETSLDEEIEIECFDGTHKFVLNSAVPLRDAQGEITGAVVINQDITNQKKTELALSDNYSTLHNILESTDALIFSVNRQYCYTSFNSAHATKMKVLYDQNIQVGGNLLEYMTVENDRIMAKQNIDRCLAGEHLVEESFSGDEAFSRLYFEVSHAPIITDAGEIVGVSIFSKDITKRKQTELSLQLRLMELETVSKLSVSMRAGKNVKELLFILLNEALKAVNTVDGCILLLDPVNNLLNLTESRGWFEALTDLSFNINEGIVGHVFTTKEPYISLDIQNDKLISSRTRAFIQPQSSGAFFPVHGENGTIGVLIISFQLPRVISENELRLLAIISQLGANAISRSRLHDQIQSFNLDLQNEIHKKIVIQELLAAEKELLSTTLMSIADGVIVTDKDGLVILFNQAAESITGYTLSEAIKKPVSNVFKLHISNTFEIVPDVIKYLLELENAQKNHMAYRSPLIVTKTGERILLAGSITSLKSADLEEDTVGFVLVFQNINEKLKAEAQNVLSQKMEAIGQLAAGIAHEINTPIQYVGDNIKFLGKAYSKYSEMLAVYRQVIHEHLEKPITQDDLDQLNELARQKKVSYYANEIPKAIQESLDGTERVRKIVLAMREFSHPSEKEKKLSNINHGIETTIIISRNEWKYCAELETDLDDELPLICCQIDEINQVVLNMIVNAAQAIQEKTPQGSEQKGKIFISTRTHENKVFIVIQDTGSGIPPEIRARIFDPFFTTKGIGKGTGQGLSMAHNIIVKKHMGKIGIDSEPGQGTTFTIELPVGSSILEQ
jgi:PAS domain S-box-containing protein